MFFLLPQEYSLENLISFVEPVEYTETTIQIMSKKSQSQDTKVVCALQAGKKTTNPFAVRQNTVAVSYQMRELAWHTFR